MIHHPPPIQISEPFNIKTTSEGVSVNNIYSRQVVSFPKTGVLLVCWQFLKFCDSVGSFQVQRWPTPGIGVPSRPCENFHVPSVEILHGGPITRRVFRFYDHVITSPRYCIVSVLASSWFFPRPVVVGTTSFFLSITNSCSSLWPSLI